MRDALINRIFQYLSNVTSAVKNADDAQCIFVKAVINTHIFKIVNRP